MVADSRRVRWCRNYKLYDRKLKPDPVIWKTCFFKGLFCSLCSRITVPSTCKERVDFSGSAGDAVEEILSYLREV